MLSHWDLGIQHMVLGEDTIQSIIPGDPSSLPATILLMYKQAT